LDPANGAYYLFAQDTWMDWWADSAAPTGYAHTDCTCVFLYDNCSFPTTDALTRH